MRLQNTSTLDFDSIDEWAVDLVVNEGVLMNLGYTEKVVAVNRMINKKIRLPEIADRLRIPESEVAAMRLRWVRQSALQSHRVS